MGGSLHIVVNSVAATFLIFVVGVAFSDVVNFLLPFGSDVGVAAREAANAFKVSGSRALQA